MSRALLRRAIGPITAAVVALLVTGCSTSGFTSHHSADPTSTSPQPSQHTTSGPPPPPPAAPTVGQCRNLVHSSIKHYSNGTPTVPCSKPHTAYTFAVLQLPASVDVQGVSIGNPSIQNAAAKACTTAFTAYVGGDATAQALARLSPTYFLPPQAGFNRGASWIRCDIVALQDFNTLAPLPATLKGILANPKVLTTYGVCSTGEPGDKDSVLVMCSQKHEFKAVTALRLGAADAAYPGTKKAGPASQQTCKTFVEHLVGADAGYTYAWTYPTATDWGAGQRYGYCWLKSAS